MADSEGLQATRVNLVLGSRGIEIDEKGRIRFVDPEILQALVSGSPADRAELASDGNSSACTVINGSRCENGTERPDAEPSSRAD